jgi:Uri superfamily endonuclease
MTYALWIVLERDIKISVGSLGEMIFKKGIYFYVGSAKKNFYSRIARHLRKDKKIFWHIDYLLASPFTKVMGVIWRSNIAECQLAQDFLNRKYKYVSKFGCSDCKCQSHLFYRRD